MKPSSGAETKTVIPVKAGAIDYAQVRISLAVAFSKNAKATHILPSKTTKYDQVIKLMDMAKQVGILNIGLSPI